jgi:hypothetical protein
MSQLASQFKPRDLSICIGIGPSINQSIDFRNSKSWKTTKIDKYKNIILHSFLQYLHMSTCGLFFFLLYHFCVRVATNWYYFRRHFWSGFKIVCHIERWFRIFYMTFKIRCMRVKFQNLEFIFWGSQRRYVAKSISKNRNIFTII